MYNVKIEKFEGPFGLLLDLIEEKKLHVSELSLAQVADQYLEHIRGNERIDLANLAEFLLVASKLILIKSRALLPVLELTEEEEEDIKDLARQLEEYKKFKEASQAISRMLYSSRASYCRESYIGTVSDFYPPENINAFDLKKYFQIILSEIPVIDKLEEELVAEVITLEEKIAYLQSVIAQRMEIHFSEVTEGSLDKVEIVVSFLAILEMVKQRIIQVEQGELFEEIRIRNKELR